MLQKIRAILKGKLAKLIVVLFALPFAFFGVSFFSGAGQSPVVLVVNSEEINTTELQQAINMKKWLFLQQAGEDFDASSIDNELFQKLALDDLQQELVLAHAAKKNTLRAPDKLIDTIIISSPAFSDGLGFSETQYTNVLARIGVTPIFFRKLQQNRLLATQLTSILATTSFSSSPEVDQFVSLLGEKRDIRYLLYPISEYKSRGEISSADARQYYNEHSSDFISEEKVSVEYIELKISDYFTDVSEDEILTEFEFLKDEGQLPVQYHIAHILLENNSDNQIIPEVEIILDALANGENFSELAKRYSQDFSTKDNGGDLGYVELGVMPIALENAFTKLKPKEISAPISTEFGVHIVKLIDIIEPNYNELKNDLRVSLQQSQAQTKFNNLVEELSNITYDAPDLKNAHNLLNVPIKVSMPFAQVIEQNADTDINRFPLVIENAFSSPVRNGHNSDLLQLEEGYYVVLRQKKRYPAQQRPLSEVQEKIIEILQAQQAEKKALADAQRFITELEQGITIRELALDRGWEWNVGLGESRINYTIPEQIIVAAMAVENVTANKSAGSVRIGDDRIAVFTVSISSDQQDTTEPQLRQALFNNLAQQNSNLEISLFNTWLKNKADIVISEELQQPQLDENDI